MVRRLRLLFAPWLEPQVLQCVGGAESLAKQGSRGGYAGSTNFARMALPVFSMHLAKTAPQLVCKFTLGEDSTSVCGCLVRLVLPHGHVEQHRLSVGIFVSCFGQRREGGRDFAPCRGHLPRVCMCVSVRPHFRAVLWDVCWAPPCLTIGILPDTVASRAGKSSPNLCSQSLLLLGSTLGGREGDVGAPRFGMSTD